MLFPPVVRYSVSLTKSIGRLKFRLQDIIEPNYELPSVLVARSVINVNDVERLKVEKTTVDRNGVLIDHLSNQSEARCEHFLEALRDTNQKHVIHFIRCPHGL